MLTDVLKSLGEQEAKMEDERREVEAKAEEEMQAHPTPCFL